MLTGVLVLESLRVGSVLEGVPLVVTRLERTRVTDASERQPPVWTLLAFEAAEEHGAALGGFLQAALEPGPGWYADFHSAGEKVVVYPDRVFRYPRGDGAARQQAVAHGRRLGIPETQLDWPE